MEIFLMILGALLGGILSIMTTLLIEYYRKPKLTLEIEKNSPIINYEERKPAKIAKFPHIKVINKPTTKFEVFMNRFVSLNTAFECHGEINFYHYENCFPVLSSPVPIRWTNSDDYLLPFIQNEEIQQILDASKINSTYYHTCYPMKVESIDVVGRFDDEDDCYGWTTISTIGSPLWRKPQYRLSKGLYFVKIGLRSESTEVTKIFILENTSGLENFRLLEVSKKEIEIFNSYNSN